MFPEETIHCVEWARDHFSKMFTIKPKSAINLLEAGESIGLVAEQDINMLKEGLKLLRKRPVNFNSCLEYARKRFEKYFNHDVKQLLHVYPLDAKTKEGTLFWTLPKLAPTPLVFDQNNVTHYTFVSSMACLFAQMFYIEIPSKTPRTEEFRKQCGIKAAAFKQAEFVPNDDKAKSIAKQIADADKDKSEENKQEEEEESEPQVDQNDLQKQKDDFIAILKNLPIDKKLQFGDYLVKSEEFEKDDDKNFHIDFMASMGNCRAASYQLDLMDWL